MTTTDTHPCPACGGPLTPCGLVSSLPGAVRQMTAAAWQCDACNSLTLPGAVVAWLLRGATLCLTEGTDAKP